MASPNVGLTIAAALAGGITITLLVAFLMGYLERVQRERRTLRRLEPAFPGISADPTRARLNAQVETIAQQQVLGQQLDHMLDEAQTQFSLGGFLINVIMLAVIVFLVVLLLSGSLLVALPLGIATVFVPYFWLKRRGENRWKQFNQQLPQAIDVLTSALRAGASDQQALEQIVVEMGPPLKDEFRTVVEQIKIGRPLEDALEDLRKRAHSEELDSFAATLSIQKRSGGDLADLMSEASELMREDMRLRQELLTMTSQARLSAQLVSLLPFVLLFVIYIFNPQYIAPLFNNPVGLALTSIAFTAEIIGYFVINQMATFKV